MSIFVTDTFTEASDTTLASHTGETGATWTSHPSYSGTVLVNASLDRAYLNSSAAGGYYASGIPASADYSVQVDFFRLTQLATNVAIIVGFDTSADTGILLRLNDTGSAVQWEVIDRVTGSNTILNGGAATSGTSLPSVGGAATTAKLVRTGTSITVFFNGVQDMTLNCTTGITATGRAGVRFSAAAPATSTTGIHINNLSGVDTGSVVVPTMGYLKGPRLRPAIFKPGLAR